MQSWSSRCCPRLFDRTMALCLGPARDSSEQGFVFSLMRAGMAVSPPQMGVASEGRIFSFASLKAGPSPPWLGAPVRRLCHTHWTVASWGQDCLCVLSGIPPESHFRSFPSAWGSLELGQCPPTLGFLRTDQFHLSLRHGTQFLPLLPAQAQPFCLGLHVRPTSPVMLA